MLLLDTLIHWIHLLSAITWGGGMIFTGLILTPIARKDLPVELRYTLFKKIGRRFSIVGWISVSLLIATGIYKLSSVWQTTDFFHSAFGIALTVKLILVAFVLFLSLLHDFVWGPRLASKETLDPKEHQALVWKLSFWAKVSTFLVVAIIFMGSFLRMNPF